MTPRNEGQLINVVLSFWQSRIITMGLNDCCLAAAEEELNTSFFGVKVWFIQSHWGPLAWRRWLAFIDKQPLSATYSNYYDSLFSSSSTYLADLKLPCPQGRNMKKYRSVAGQQVCSSRCWWLSTRKCQYHTFRQRGMLFRESAARWASVRTFEAEMWNLLILLRRQF